MKDLFFKQRSADGRHSSTSTSGDRFDAGGSRLARRSGQPRLRRLLPVVTGVSALALSMGTAALVSAQPAGADTSTDPVVTDTNPDSPTQVPKGYTAPANDGLGIAPGKIKHVWLIVEENKSYDASFTGLDGNSYLWQTLPEQGALLTNYFGTGHSSEDNYLSMVSGQSPISDDQNDCPNYNLMSGHMDMTGSLSTNQDYGQFISGAGDNAPIGDNGCVYPEDSSDQTKDNPTNTVETLFNQMDAAGETWKDYVQDLDGDDNGDGSVPANGNDESVGHSAGAQYCGAPYDTPGATPSASQTVNPATVDPNPGSANAKTQYVPKHNPTPWFESVLQSGDCAKNVVPVLGADDQLATDLKSESMTPDLSVIIPNNCSDAHDAVCAGNNLSGGFEDNGQSQIANAPENYTGGLYSADLFLQKVIPEIMASPAYQDGGLIDITFDEAYMPFTWDNSFANSSLVPATSYGGMLNDLAGETLYGRSVNWEPTGPNDTIETSKVTGQVLTPGPGFNERLDRPNSAIASSDPQLYACSNGTSTTSTTPETGNGWVTSPLTSTTIGTETTEEGCDLGGGSTITTSDVTYTGLQATAGSPTLSVSKSQSHTLSAKNEGQQVTQVTDMDNDNLLPSATDTYYLVDAQSTWTTTSADQSSTTSNYDLPYTNTFEIYDETTGQLVPFTTTEPVNVTLAGEDAATDPFYDAFDSTDGGGDTGSVLLSPYIKPGTVSQNYYNHYSLLRTLEGIFQVDKTSDGSTAAAGTTQGGLDGEGHLGYAAQPGLAPFGTDVFTDANLGESTPTVTNTVTAPGKTVTNTKTKTKKVPMCVVPNVKGYALAEARVIVRAAQCKVGRLRGNRKGVVTKQSLAPGKHESSGKAVSLTFKARKH